MPQHFPTLHGIDQGWTRCPNLDVVLYRKFLILPSNSQLIVLLCLFFSTCIVLTVCVCIQFTSCLLQNLKIKKIKKINLEIHLILKLI